MSHGVMFPNLKSFRVATFLFLETQSNVFILNFITEINCHLNSKLLKSKCPNGHFLLRVLE